MGLGTSILGTRNIKKSSNFTIEKIDKEIRGPILQTRVE
jgi:hypothetical protein